jgi:hypothetical protein
MLHDILNFSGFSARWVVIMEIIFLQEIIVNLVFFGILN